MTDTTAQVAIIEDNEDLREEMIFFLRARNHAVWGVSSAEQFWKELHRHPVDIVLVDIGLPGEDGFSVLDYLRTLGGFGLVVTTAGGAAGQTACAQSGGGPLPGQADQLCRAGGADRRSLAADSDAEAAGAIVPGGACQ